MMRSVVCFLLLSFAMSVGATERAKGIPFGSSSDADYLDWLKPTTDATYGVTKENPVEIGGFLGGDGSRWSAQYFSSLLGPNGEATQFERKGSCCGFEVTDPELRKEGFDIGFLDAYEVTIEGKPPIVVYVSLYAESEVFAPPGFTTRGNGKPKAEHSTPSGPESAQFLTDPLVLNCSPPTLRASGKLIATLGPGHGRELAIRRVADDAWYYLVVGIPETSAQQLMTPAQFAVATRVEIPTSIQARNTVGTLEAVFTKPGEYEAYVSDNLESEAGGYRCRFDYAGATR